MLMCWLGAKFGLPAFPTWIKDWLTFFQGYHTHAAVSMPAIKFTHNIMDTLIDHAYIDRSFKIFNTSDSENSSPTLAGISTSHSRMKITLTPSKSYRRSLSRFTRHTSLLGCLKDYCSFKFIFTTSRDWTLEMLERMLSLLIKSLSGEWIPWPFKMGFVACILQHHRWRAIRDEFDPKAHLSASSRMRIYPRFKLNITGY